MRYRTKASFACRRFGPSIPQLVDCFAPSFKTQSNHVVFSGDSAPIPEKEEFARGADLLIHEAMLEAALPALMARIGNSTEKLMAHWLRFHTFAHDAARIAASAGVKTLALSHLIPSDDPDYTELHWREAVDGVSDGSWLWVVMGSVLRCL